MSDIQFLVLTYFAIGITVYYEEEFSGKITVFGILTWPINVVIIGLNSEI